MQIKGYWKTFLKKNKRLRQAWQLYDSSSHDQRIHTDVFKASNDNNKQSICFANTCKVGFY